jgi:multisubunit Na+/H+ antiporter MnhB subunit
MHRNTLVVFAAVIGAFLISLNFWKSKEEKNFVVWWKSGGWTLFGIILIVLIATLLTHGWIRHSPN